MTIKWTNIVFLLAVIFAFFLWHLYRESIVGFFASLTAINRSDASHNEKVEGMLAAAFVVITMLGVMRLVINHQNRDNNRDEDDHYER